MNYLPNRASYRLLLLFFTFFFSKVHAAETDVLTPAAPVLSASSYLLQDFNSGKVLAQNNVDAKLAPASLTKILTVYVIFDEIKNGHLKLDEGVTISQNAWKTSGSKMFVNVNDHVKVEDLLKGVIVQSGNDASVALAEHVAGNEAAFAELMNQHAARLGMINSHFVNADGLPSDGHYSTARDLAILTTALIKHFPQYYSWFSLKEFTYNKITQPNRNLLLSRDSSVDGVKTGHTDEAGYCLVASALREDMRLISVVMGTESENARASANQTLLNYGFRFFETRRFYQANTSVKEVRIWKGDSDMLPLGVAEDLNVTVPRRNNNELKATLTHDKQILAPVKAGDKLGKIIVKIGDETVATRDLIAIKTIEKGGIFRRLYDSLLMLFRKDNG